MPIGRQQVQQARATLNRCREGKANLERRMIENEQWYRLRHWECIRRTDSSRVEPTSGWLFNAIANKHADVMDNYPAPNVLAREEGDREEAQLLSAVLPVILEQCNFEEVYDRVNDYKLKMGTGIYGVFWDSSALGGLGEVAIRRVDILNLFWDSGIEDIQDSRNVFHVQLQDNDLLLQRYPQLQGSLGEREALSSYRSDDRVDTQNKSAVVDWYYKKNGVLHFCKFCADTVLYATENDPACARRGWYDHGRYPFVFDPLFRVAASPCGFGYIDVGKSAQEYIDRGNQAILQNLLVNARPRHFIRADGAVNEEEYADLNSDFIHVDGNLGEDSIRPVPERQLGRIYLDIISGKIEELKEVTGNRDVSTGGIASGVTAASAIAAMQEAGSKLSRDSNKAAYRAFRQVCLLVIELIRQFYTLPRCFRILGQAGTEEYIHYSNAGLLPRDQGEQLGVALGQRTPLFDIEITAQKQSPYSRLSQNEMALQFYNAGLFNPKLADQALLCLELMDFDRKQQLMHLIARRAQTAPQSGENAGKLTLGSQQEAYTTRKARQRAADAASPV